MAQPGSAPAWHAGGQGFESPWIHHRRLTRNIVPKDSGKPDTNRLIEEVARKGGFFVFRGQVRQCVVEPLDLNELRKRFVQLRSNDLIVQNVDSLEDA